MDKPLFTVVIPCYNREKTVEKAIRSVLCQTFSRWKLLIVDDASTDRSREKIEPFLRDPRIRLLRLPKNVGISKVMNRALREIDTPYFVQLDSDDWLERDALAEFAKAIGKADGRTALFYGNIKMMQKRNGKWRVKRCIRHRPFKDKYDFLQYLTYMLHPRCYRTEAVRSVGGWDTDDPYEGRLMEDRRICLKLIERYPFYWIDKFLYNRRKHKLQLTNPQWMKKRNFMRRYVIENCLQKWGNEYRPVYRWKNGYLVIEKLAKKSPLEGGD
ncbi:glycosyltransferase family A protein [Bacillaceae bacterium]